MNSTLVQIPFGGLAQAASSFVSRGTADEVATFHRTLNDGQDIGLESGERIRAVALMSGGLDSGVAVRLVHDLGTDLVAVHFMGPFCMCNRGAGGCGHYARNQADALGIPLETHLLGSEYLEIVSRPRHGYGSGMNPCLDCRILMLKKAKAVMAEKHARFIVTGEVLGQRPMSQLRDKLRLIENESGLEGLILRPLSAAHLPKTIPEKEGWIDRTRLLGLQGRRRGPQIEMARQYGIGDYPCPAGGCLLTDVHFATRLREHLRHGTLSMTDIPLLKTGRHFRLPDGSKLVVGRNEKENDRLALLATSTDLLLNPVGTAGPTTLLRPVAPPAGPEETVIKHAARITAAYCDGPGSVYVECVGRGARQTMTSTRLAREKCQSCAF